MTITARGENAAATRPQAVSSEKSLLRVPSINIAYLRSFSGILKSIQCLLIVICLVIIALTPQPVQAVFWTHFVSISSFVVTITLLLGNVFSCIQLFHCVPWVLVVSVALLIPKLLFDFNLESVYCLIWVVFYFIAGCMIAHFVSNDSKSFSGNNALTFVMVLCFTLVLLYAIDSTSKFRSWQKQEEEEDMGHAAASTESTTQQPTPV